MSNKIYERDGDRMYIDSNGSDNGYGNGGFGGIGAIIALVVVVAILWFLAREGRGCNDGCYNGGGYPYPPAYPYPPVYPYGGGNCCNSPLDCKIPMAPDMSNCEVDKDIWKLDAHMERCCCEEKEATHMEGEKTRALIEANYIQDLRDKLAAAAAEKGALESKYFTEKKFGDLEALLCKYDQGNDKQYYKLDSKIDALNCYLDCNVPKRAPIYACGTTPDVHNIDCHDYFPKRRGFNDGCGCDKDCCCG